MDGVLVDRGASHRAAWAALLGELGERPRPPDFWRLTIGRPTEEALPLVLGRRVPAHEAWELARRKRDLYVELAWRGMTAVAGVSTFASCARSVADGRRCIEKCTVDRLDRAFQSGAVDPEVREALEGLEGRIVRDVDQSAIETRRQIEASAVETRQYVDRSVAQVREDLRRHFDVVAESLRSDIRAMPEATGGGYASQAEMTALSRRTSRLEGRMDDLEKTRRRRKR